MHVRRSVDQLLKTPRVQTAPFDKAVDGKLDNKVQAARNAGAAEALAFFGAEPADAAGPLKDAKDGAGAGEK